MRTIILAAALAALSPAAASAHAHLDRATPAANSVVADAPSEVHLWFSEALEPRFSKAELRSTSGAVVATGGADPADRKALDRAGQRTQARQIQGDLARDFDRYPSQRRRLLVRDQALMGLEADAVFWRFLQFTALTVLFGAVLFRFQAIDEQHASPSALAALDRWLWRLATSCAVIALVSALGWLVATATNMIGDLAGALRISGLRTVLTETRFGLVWEWRIAILLVLIVVLVLARFGQTPNPARASVAVLAGFALATLSGVGHAVMNAGTAGDRPSVRRRSSSVRRGGLAWRACGVAGPLRVDGFGPRHGRTSCAAAYFRPWR